MGTPWLEDNSNGLTDIVQMDDIDGQTFRITLDEETFIELTKAMVALTARRTRAKLLAEVAAAATPPEKA